MAYDPNTGLATWSQNPWTKMAGSLAVAPAQKDLYLQGTGFESAGQFGRAKTGYQSSLTKIGDKYGISGLRGQWQRQMASRGMGEAQFGVGGSERQIGMGASGEASEQIGSWLNLIQEGRDTGSSNLQANQSVNQEFAFRNYDDKTSQLSQSYITAQGQASAHGYDKLSNALTSVMNERTAALQADWQGQTFNPSKDYGLFNYDKFMEWWKIQKAEKGYDDLNKQSEAKTVSLINEFLSGGGTGQAGSDSESTNLGFKGDEIRTLSNGTKEIFKNGQWETYKEEPSEPGGGGNIPNGTIQTGRDGNQYIRIDGKWELYAKGGKP